jgi:N-carbamoylputrescine amidase
MSSRDVTIALVQMSCAEDPAKNLDKAVSRVAEAAKNGAQVVCLQELFASRYFCQVNDKKFFSLAETVPGPSSEVLAKASRSNKVAIVASLFEKDGLNYYNTACVLDADGRFLGRYRKIHIPDDLENHYSELFYFKHGDLGTPVFDTKFAKIGVQVCWDQWFPEGARSLALQGAEIIFYPTAIGWPIRSDRQSRILAKIGERSRSLPDDPSSGHSRSELDDAEFDAWVTVQRGHAISNTTFVAATNRTGLEDHLQFWGASFVADPLGRILRQASHDKEETLIVQLPIGRINEVRKDWPFLTCRRTDQYLLR